MSDIETQLFQAVESATAAYDRARSEDTVWRMGAEAVRGALKEEALAHSAYTALSAVEYDTYMAQLREFDMDNNSNTETRTLADEYEDLIETFDDRAREVFGKIGIYWMGLVEPHELWLRSEETTDNVLADDLSMVVLRAQIINGELELTKEKRFGKKQQDLRISDADREILLAATARLQAVADQLSAEG